MKFLYVTDVFPPRCGGSGWSVYFFARGLREMGHEVTILSLDGHSRTYDGFSIEGWELGTSSYPFFKNIQRHHSSLPAIAERLIPLVAEHDICHAHHKWSALALGLTEIRKWFVTIRDYWPLCICGTSLYRTGDVCSAYDFARCSDQENRWKGIAAPLAYPWFGARMHDWQEMLNQSTKIFCISEYLREQLRFRFAEERLAVIHNIAEDLTLSETDELEDLQQTFVLYVGKLERHKGAQLLPQILKKSKLKTSLVIVGEGSLRPELEAEFEKNKIDVYFAGYQDYPQMLSILKHCAVVLFPSLWPEPLGRVLIEAGMMGKPAVAFDQPGGHHDILQDQVNGLLVHSVDEFAESVAGLIANPALAETMGQIARKMYRNRFSTSAVLPHLLQHYENTGG